MAEEIPPYEVTRKIFFPWQNVGKCGSAGEDKETEKQGGFQPPGQCDPQSKLPCRCPLRTNVEVPDRLPFTAVEGFGGLDLEVL